MHTVHSSDHISRGVSARGVSALGGLLLGDVCSWGVSAEGVSAPGGCLLLGASVPGGVCPRGGLLWGVSAPGGVVSKHALGQTPPPPCGQTDACKNITFATSLRAVNIIFWKNIENDVPLKNDILLWTKMHQHVVWLERGLSKQYIVGNWRSLKIKLTSLFGSI